jgi:DNA-binding response OmpR family regulator
MVIVSNLISNALKFTQVGGRAEVSTGLTEGGNFEIRVSDNGPGIMEENLPFIFDRFYRIDTGGTNIFPGSGLGLALTRELAKLLNGTVTVESIYGEGTEFTVTLPVTAEAPLQEGPAKHDLKVKLSNYIFHEPVKKLPDENNPGSRNKKPVLLLVDDNDDVVQYITILLSKDYDILVANDGKQGLDRAVENVPDIILSDIMMPVMDGIEMLRKVKNDFRTSHIPVVMLTAKADIASRLEGIGLGADAYLAKPFNSDELKIQLRALIDQRKKLQERYSVVGHDVFSDDRDFHLEDTFMKRILGIMSANLGDETFDIHRLCYEMVMSRTQLYRKFRSLTDRTITEYLRSLRLRRAKELLAGSGITVAEAAYKTGFRSASHFSRVFTREFGVNPCHISRGTPVH